jgi:hypothetical protein
MRFSVKRIETLRSSVKGSIKGIVKAIVKGIKSVSPSVKGIESFRPTERGMKLSGRGAEMVGGGTDHS